MAPIFKCDTDCCLLSNRLWPLRYSLRTRAPVIRKICHCESTYEIRPEDFTEPSHGRDPQSSGPADRRRSAAC